MRHCTSLRGLPLTIIECAAAAVIVGIADGVYGVPELLCIALVSYVFEQAGDLAVFDFVSELAAELKIIALLVYRVGTAPEDVNAFLHVADHVFYAEWFFARLQ